MKRIWVSLGIAGLLAIAAIAPAAAQSIFSVPLDDVDDSGITGGASIRGADGQVEVTAFISEGGEEGAEHPIHVHEGTCEELGDVAYPLENITEGESVTTLDLELSDLMTGEYAINAHQSEDEIDTHIMCGNIPEVEGLAAEGEGDAEGEDEEAAEGEDDADGEDEEAAEDDEAADDEAADDENGEDEEAAEDDMDDEEAAEDQEDEEDVSDVAPDAGGPGDAESGAAVLLMTVLAGGALGAGLLVRRRAVRV